MSLGVAIESSSISYSAAVGIGNQVLAHRVLRRDHPDFAGIGALVAATVAAAGHKFEDVTALAVDAGPGNLSSVRAGVSYANGLAFSLGRPVLAANSLEVLANATEVRQLPVLCLRNAGGGNVYAGLYQDGVPLAIRHGRLATVVASIVGTREEIALAGVFRKEASQAVPEVVTYDTGLEFPDAVTLYHRLHTAIASGAPGALDGCATPLTEASPVFGGAGGHAR